VLDGIEHARQLNPSIKFNEPGHMIILRERLLKYAGKILTNYFRNLLLAQLKRKLPLNSCSKEKSIFLK